MRCRTRVLVMARTSNFVDDDAAERRVGGDQQRRYPFCVARIICDIVGLAEERHGAGSIVMEAFGVGSGHIEQARSRA